MYPRSDEGRAKPDGAEYQKRRRKVLAIPKVQKRKKNYKIGWDRKPIIKPIP
jgi:hypothetical protein